MTTDLLVIEQAVCPLCHAAKGKPCVYMADGMKNHWDWGTQTRVVDSVHERGTPTKRVHNARRSKADWKLELARRQSHWQKMAKPPASLFALRAFDRAEYEQTKKWLRENGSILWRETR